MKLILVPNLPAKKKVLLILAENSPKQKVNFFRCTISREKLESNIFCALLWIVTGNFCNFLIIIQIISPTQLWSVERCGKLQFLGFRGQNFDILGLIL